MLRYTQQLYTAGELADLKAELLEQGYVVLRSVYDRDSVPAFREAVLEANRLGDISSDLSTGGGDETGLVVQPIVAPRLMQLMPDAAGPEHPRGSSSQVSCFNLGINVQGSPGAPTEPGNWHRDRGRAAWLPDGTASYPEQISVVAYFRDMAPHMGCTQILPRSHRLQLPVPSDDAASGGADGSGIEDFLPRMEDVVVWDQRCWHRKGPFVPQGDDDVRVVTIPSFNISQVRTLTCTVIWILCLQNPYVRSTMRLESIGTNRSIYIGISAYFGSVFTD
jgi:hypothetical protein